MMEHSWVVMAFQALTMALAAPQYRQDWLVPHRLGFPGMRSTQGFPGACPPLSNAGADQAGETLVGDNLAVSLTI